MKRLVFRLRPEEALALVFLLPTTYLTLSAYVFARAQGDLGARYPGGVARLVAAVAFLCLLGLAQRRWPVARWVRGLRETLPFLVCVLIYTNLHDTIGFVNQNDVHHQLIAIDAWLFGVQPCVWSERFITPGRTELFQALYFNFFWIAPAVPLVLLLQRRWQAFRAATLGIVVCFYLGYALYVLFPAAPPRLTLVHEFTRSLRGYPSLMTGLADGAFALLPTDSRAAFPSLHAAVSLLALVYAWRLARRFFWLLLPCVVGLWLSTVYLRHHYVIDLFAGWALAPVAFGLAPWLDGWWAGRQRALGHTPARGAQYTPATVQRPVSTG